MTRRPQETILDSPTWTSGPGQATAAQPLVSLIVAAYNCERYVEEMLRSLQDQTYPALEIIVVHDGGTDGTGRLARLFVAATARPARLVDWANHGVTKALQRGLHEARGTYVCFFDADDVMLPGKTALQVRQLQDGHLDGVVGNFEWLVEGQRAPYPDAPEIVDPWDAEAFVASVVGSWGPMYSAGLYRRDLVLSMGGIDQGMRLNDWPFLIAYARATRRMAVTRDVVFLYRKHPASHSSAHMHELLAWKRQTWRRYCSPEVTRKSEARAYRLIAEECLVTGRPVRAVRWFRRADRIVPQLGEPMFRREVRRQLLERGWHQHAVGLLLGRGSSGKARPTSPPPAAGKRE